MWYVDPESLNDVMLEIKQDILDECEVQVKKKIRLRAYKTGRLMRSVENETGEEVVGEASVGSDVFYSYFVDRLRFLFNPDITIDRAFNKLFDR